MSTKLVSVVTGAFPTVTPTHNDLLGRTVTPDASDTDVDARILVSAGTGTLTLLGWDGTVWCPIVDISLDSTVYGGVAFSRSSPGSNHTSYALWERTAGATVSSARITTGRLR